MAKRKRRSSGWWGVALAAAVVALAVNGAWRQALPLAGVWLVYLLWLWPMQCRAETGGGNPCTLPTNGLLGPDRNGHHPSAKLKSLPILTSGGILGLPQLMWPRPAGTGRPATAARSGPPPGRPPAAPSADRVGTWIAAAGLVVAILSFIHDLIAS